MSFIILNMETVQFSKKIFPNNEIYQEMLKYSKLNTSRKSHWKNLYHLREVAFGSM